MSEYSADKLGGYIAKYYCKVCEDFFQRNSLAPGTFCPVCGAPAQYIMGPFPVIEIDIKDYEKQWYKDRANHKKAQKR